MADLRKSLTSVGRGVIAQLVDAKSLKQCSFIAPQVMMYLQSEGFTVSGSGSGTPGHVDLSVLTADDGWVIVDPTHVQYEFKGDGTHDEEEEAAVLRRLAELWLDPSGVSKITKAGGGPRPPLEPDAHKQALANQNESMRSIGSSTRFASLRDYLVSRESRMEAKLSGRSQLRRDEAWMAGVKEALESM